MWRALVKGAGSLDRNSKCTYDPLYDIPVTNCSDTSRIYLSRVGLWGGLCVEGICQCHDGFTGKSDWINLDDLDCHINFAQLYTYATYGLIGSTAVYLQSFRLLYKTYTTSKDKEFRSQIAMVPNQVALFMLLAWFPTMILCISKMMDPNVILVDPKENPFFFTFTFLCMNAEWWTYSILFKNIVAPTIKGLRRDLDDGKIALVEKAMSLSERVPASDLIARVFLIVPALVGGLTDNKSVIIWAYFIYRFYSFTKYIVYLGIYSRCIYLAIHTMDGNIFRNSQSIKTGSTGGGKIKTFKRKMDNLVRFVAFVVILHGLMNLEELFMEENKWYGEFINFLMSNRGGIGIANAIMVELLYLDHDRLERMARYCCPRKSDEGRETSPTLKLTTGSFGKRSSGVIDDDEEFQGENPMRESQVHESKTPSSIRTLNPVAALSIATPKRAQLY